jgi:DNA-directed RNA polymerase subunit RPC12/RpoP
MTAKHELQKSNKTNLENLKCPECRGFRVKGLLNLYRCLDCRELLERVGDGLIPLKIQKGGFGGK